jgi:hypothetical protein
MLSGIFRMNKTYIGSILLFVSLTSCSSVYIKYSQNKSSGLVGCHPKEITIEENDVVGGTWTAICKNIKFYCSESNELVNCKEAK